MPYVFWSNFSTHSANDDVISSIDSLSKDDDNSKDNARKH